MKSIPLKVKKAVLLRDRVCVDCGGFGDWRGLAIHHIKHKKMGGNKNLDTLTNLVLLCGECHSARHGIVEK